LTQQPPSTSSEDPIAAGDRLYAQHQPRAALALYEAAIRQVPENAESHYRAAIASRDLGRHAAALQHMAKAVRVNPGFVQGYVELAHLFLTAGESGRALEAIRRAAELAPQEVQLQVDLANVLEADRQIEAAAQQVDQLLAAGKRTPRLAVTFARLSGPLKREAEALALIKELQQNLGAYAVRERAALHFATANLLDRMGRYDEAFQEAAKGNGLRGPRYNPALVERLVDSSLAYFTPQKLAKLPRATHGSQLPVFIVGMPRSGTSLIEQILASHPQAFGGGESERVYFLWDAAVRRLASPEAPLADALDRMTVTDANELAADYLETIRAIRPSAARFTEKTPWNSLHLGLIALLLPRARVIHCRRDPMDTGLSCFMTDFAHGNNFSFDLASIAHFQKQTDRLMAHWKSVLDLPILEVDYERVVKDLEGQTRRLLEFVGLPWDERCVRFHENPRAVTTASQAQVRRPIYASSVGRWRHYVKWLEPLRAAMVARVSNP
jgi:tetratricopeptide (TPR) repeat protein